MGLQRAAWLERRYGARIEWLPYDLHPEYPPEGVPRSKLEAYYGESFALRVRSMIEEAGFAYNPPDTIPNSRHSLEVAELARDRGCFQEVHGRLFRAHWSESRDIGSVEVLVEIGETASLEAAEVEKAVADGRYLERIRDATRRAGELGVDGVPAWMIDDRLLVPGAQPLTVFEQAMNRLGHEAVDGGPASGSAGDPG